MVTTSTSNSSGRHGTATLSPEDQALLAQPLTLPFSGKVIKNRFCKAALSESLGRSDGHIDKEILERHVHLYDAWARGGSGLILTGNLMVDRTMREMEHNVAVEDLAELDHLKVWAQTVQKQGAALYAQINHPGRQTYACLTPEPVAPSAVPVSNFPSFIAINPPRELSNAEVKGLIKSFVETSVVLYKAGFDGVQLHAAHGFLISQFLNPRTNHRTDEYGGTPENRSRFLSEIVQGIKAATPKSFSIGVKVNSVDFGRQRKDQDGNGGMEEDLEEGVKVAVMLEQLGVDFIEVSGGCYESFAAGLMEGKGIPDDLDNLDGTQKTSTQKREGHFAIFAERISSALSTTKVILTGGFVSATAMADALKTTTSATQKPHIDMVGLGRSVCTEPDLPNRILSGSVTGAIRLPWLPGGYFSEVYMCGGNMRRMAFQKEPLSSLPWLFLSPDHAAYGMTYGRVIGHKLMHPF
ncbi:hypothetical protein BGZ50_002544 [Haplosporangium sp. Z 11]|nr:hypothetical protein BGZ50_002544 [Haplosporangium sp. Z 11]